jgi:VWFA-related protein
MYMRIIQIATLAGVLAGTGMYAQPSTQQTFKGGVEYVEIDAVVTDRQGHFARNLSKSDFQVLEDGKPQTVSVFNLVDIPTNRSISAHADNPGAHDNEGTQGRLFVMVLDDLHTPPLRTPQVRRAASLFVKEHMGPNDLAAVVTTSGRSNASHDLTGNKQLLLRAVDGFLGQRSFRVDELLDAERGFNARIAMSTLRDVAGRMGELHGRRKALVFISEGIDYDIYDVFDARDATIVRDEVRAAISAATRSNVSIYSVDPRGLTSLADEDIERGKSSPSIGPGSSSERLRLAQDSLRILSDMTGGFAAVNSNDFAGIFDRIVRDNSTYYLLGFNPTNDKRDGRFRKIDVRVARDGLMVRARKGYALPREERRR